MRAIALIIVLCLVVPQIVFSQCFEINRIIKQAKELYNQGDLESTIRLLDGLEQNKKAKSCPVELEKAQILLTQSYLFLNQDTQAEATYKDILKRNPSYIPNTFNHPIDLIYLSERFVSLPTSKFTVNILRNNPILTIGEIYLPDELSTGTKTYFINSNYGFGFQYGHLINNDWELSIGTEYEERRFEVDYYDDYTSPITLFTDYTVKEKQVWLKFPVLLQKRFGKKEYLKYKALSGIETHVLTNASFEEIRGTAVNNERLFDNDIRNLRTNLHFGLTAGIGIEYQFPSLLNNAISVQLKYTFVPTIVNNPNMRNSRDDLYNRFGYLDDDFRFDIFQFSFGYSFIQYKVKDLQMK